MITNDVMGRKPTPEHLKAKCKNPTCDETVRAKGFCWKHYQRLVRGGDPMAPPAIERPHQVITRVSKECWRYIQAKAKASHTSAYDVAGEILETAAKQAVIIKSKG